MAQRGDFYQLPPSPTGGGGYSATGLAEHPAPVSGFDDPRVSGGTDVGAAPAAPPATKTPFWKTRKFIICQIISFLLFIVILFVLLYPVVKAIAQLVVKRSQIEVNTARIISPGNESFILNMTGRVTHTGIFSATIKFKNSVNVSWVDSEDVKSNNLRPLGYIKSLSDLHAHGSKRTAGLDQQSEFIITDQEAFGDFTAAMITRFNFTWLLESNDLDVRALKFPTSHGIKFKQRTTLKGINNFQGEGKVRLVDFKLPRNDPQGGITFSATTELDNPSPFEVALGTAVFDLTYQGVALGRGTSTNTQLVPGKNNITLEGRLIEHTDANELVVLGDLFTKYLNGESAPVKAQGVSTLQSDGTAISWLSQGLQALIIDVPFQAPSAINPIRAIDIGYLNLDFTPDTAWSPATSSDQVTAQLALPFGFSTNISEISNSFSIVQNGREVAKLETPPSASTSDIRVLSETDTEGTINITLKNSPLQVPGSGHADFSRFNADLTSAAKATFQLVGQSRAVAQLPIGRIVLDPIRFNVTSSLDGLQGLKNYVTIKTVDVLGGTSEHLNLGLTLDIYNPSSLNLDTGDLTLQLQKDGAVIGTSLISGLKLNRGDNSLDGTGAFTPNANDQGKQVLNDFVSGKQTIINVAGYDGSTQIASLLEAFDGLDLTTELPGLNSSLLQSASLEVLETTGHGNNIAHVKVDLSNPFTSGLTVTAIRATVKSHGITLGTIDTKVAFDAAGKRTTTSPSQDIDLNLDPASLFTVTRDLAVDAGLSTQQLDGIVALGGYEYVGPPPSKRHVYRGKRQGNIYTGFDLPDFVDAAFKALKSDVTLSTDVRIGEYDTTIEFAQDGLPTSTDESLHLLLPILAQPIVQKIVSGSQLGISTVLITDPAERSFKNQLKGSITSAGPFDAEIRFNDGLTISWSGKPLGKIAMPPVQVVGDVGATLDLTADFEVADVGHLTEFTKTLLNDESFEWEIMGENLTVNALGISVTGISLPTKKVSLKGMNGLKGGVVINSFDLPSNDQEGGIHLTLNTTITNPAQVGVELDSITFQNFYGTTHLGPATSAGGVFRLLPQATFEQALVGRLIPQQEQSGLDDVSAVFTAFIHGKNSDVVVRGDTSSPSVSWLSTGLKSLSIGTVLPSRGVFEVITSIDLHELTLDFTPDTAYAPKSSSKATTAAFQLPFAFPLDIVAVQQDIHVGYGGSNDMAVLSIPKIPAKTDVEARIINLAFDGVPFAVQGGQNGNFQQFLASTTMSKTQSFELSGSANTDASTAVGLLKISDIAFDVTTTINGLQGLNAAPAIVSNLDVNRGFSDHLLIKVSTDLLNPSNITISSGDVSFNLQFDNNIIGTAKIASLVLVPGHANYSTDVWYSPQGGAVPSGQKLLQNYIQGVTSSTNILGTTDATNVDSLRQAFAQISLGADIPALHQNLITSASLVFPNDILTTEMAQTTFDLDNPFTASINLLVVGANATYKGLYLGAIENVDRTGNPITAPGHTKITSPVLPLHFNLDPINIIKLLTLRAQDSGTNLGPLPELFQMVLDNPNVDLPIVATVHDGTSECSSGQQFDVNGAILQALRGMRVRLDVASKVALDEYVTELRFVQDNVTAVTDETALKLIGAVAPPIVQNLVDGASLTFSEANITVITNDGFNLDLVGSLTGTGPLDALITFVEPVDVAWRGRRIATIALPPVCAAANRGAPNYKTSGKVVIIENDAFTEFATYLLHNQAFEWEISTSKLRVTSLGSDFDNVFLKKTVTLKAFNGLPGVTISNFELPGDDPAGGITISTDSLIPSPAQLGIDLGTITFRSYFEDTYVGPLSSSNVALAPAATTRTHLGGRIVPQSGGDLETIGKLFSNFLAGKNQTLRVVGESVDPCGCGETVQWLSTAFKTLTLEVILPGHVYEIIESIEISDLGIVMMEPQQAFAPLASSKHTLAQYRNPFGFSLQAIESGQTLVISSRGVDAAELEIPMQPVEAGTSTGNLAPLTISFEDLPLRSLNNAAFAGFFALVTNLATVDAELSGTAAVIARTAIGNVPISGIPFDVTSPIKGIASFNHQFATEDVSVIGSGGAGGTEWLTNSLTVKLDNPSNISLETINMALPVYYKDVYLGRTFIENFDLVPGANTMPAEFRYKPENANDTVAQSFVTEYLSSSGDIELDIRGDSASTPFASLGPALSQVTLSGSVQGIGALLIKVVHTTITLETLVTDEVSVNFDVENPLDTDMRVAYLQVDSGLDGIIYAQFTYQFDNFIIPAHTIRNSGEVPHVKLPQGAFATLDIIPRGVLDVSFAATAVVGEGGNGYTLPWLKYHQDNVPTTYEISLGLGKLSFGDMKDAVRSQINSLNGDETTTESATSTTSSAASEVTSVVTSVADEASSVVTSAVDDASSVASSVVDDASSAASPEAEAVTSAAEDAGDVVSSIVPQPPRARPRDGPSPAAQLAPPAATATAP